MLVKPHILPHHNKQINTKKMERKIICHNVGVCPKAGKIQIITDDDAELKCPECGSEDVELVKEDQVTGPGNGKKKLIAIIAAALIIIGIVVVWLLNSGNGGNDEGMGVPPTDTTTVAPQPVDTNDKAKADSIAKAKEDSIAKAKEDSIKKAVEDSLKKIKVKKTDPKPWASYATFDGTTMTFTRTHTIPGTSRVAKPGDRVQGVWKNGEVNSVRWYHADGSPSEHLTHE